MSRYVLPVLAALIASFAVAVAVATTPARQTIQPLIVDIQQTVPFDAMVPVTLEDGSVYTAPVTLEMDINLQVGIRDAHSVTVQSAAAPSIVVSEPTPAPVPADALVIDVNETQNIGDVALTLESVTVIPFDDEVAAELTAIDRDYAYTIIEDEPTTIVAMRVTVENFGDEETYVGPSNWGVVIIGSSQIDTGDWGYFADAREIDGDIYPGVIKEGAFYFATDLTTQAIIDAGGFSYYANGPRSGDGSDYHFEVVVP